jgi:molybdopterin/thiamine biosynthesis adenylyltransferase
MADRRFGGLARLYGVAGAQAIRDAHVAVVGVGGVGSWTAEALARSGVGRITLMDMDHVSESNINRQIHALASTLGQAKVLAMKERIHQINPDCEVHCVDDFVTPENWPGILPQGVNAVIDACDQIHAKTAMAAWALRQPGVVFIAVGAAGGKRMAHFVDIDDLSRVTHDPLLAQVRYRLRKFNAAPREGRPMKVTCVFSREAVSPPDDSCQVSGDVAGDGSLNCSGYGSVVAVTASFGQCAAGWALNEISNLTPRTVKNDAII